MVRIRLPPAESQERTLRDVALGLSVRVAGSDRAVGDPLPSPRPSRVPDAIPERPEAARPTERPDALDFILRGRAARLKPDSRDSFAEGSAYSSRRWRSIRNPSRPRPV